MLCRTGASGKKREKRALFFRKEGQTGNALAKTLKNWYNSAVKLRSCQTKEALRRERLTGGLLGGGLALAWVGLCFAPGLTLDFSDLFSLSMGLTVLLLGALALFLGKEGFLRIWAFACRGRETSVGRVIGIPSARAALLVSYAAFSALLLGLTLCGDNFVRAAFGLLFCLHAGCYLKEPMRASAFNALPEGTGVLLRSDRIFVLGEPSFCARQEGDL